MTAWIWIKTYGWIVALLVAGAVVYFLTLGRRKLPTVELVLEAKRRAAAEAKVAVLLAEKGYVEAMAAIETDFRTTVEKLNVEQKQEAARLVRDPRKLARFLAAHAGE